MKQNEKIREAAAFLQYQFPEVPETVVVLGSGLGDFAESFDNKKEMAYRDIPHFPSATVPGHKGMLVYGERKGKKIFAMQGRFHYYEGNELRDVVFPIQVFAKMGVKNVILTCAVGAINETYQPGDLVLIKDHIKFALDNPLRGSNPDCLGERFFDMSDAYTAALRERAKNCAQQLNIPVKEGVYALMGGPNFETPAEIRMLRILGADMVGMSTVPEAIAAAHAGMKLLGIACCSNMAAGILEQPLSHQEVLETADKIAGTFKALLGAVLDELNGTAGIEE